MKKYFLKKYYSFKFQLNRLERKELKKELGELEFSGCTFAATDRIKSVLYELGYRVETRGRLAFSEKFFEEE